jgi:hypothetical protein
MKCPYCHRLMEKSDAAHVLRCRVEYEQKVYTRHTTALAVQKPQCCENGTGAPSGVCAKCEADNRILMDAVYIG